MEKDFGITIGDDGLPTQKFNGKDFKLYPREYYFSRGTKRIHVQVWESVNGKTPKGFHIHHKDGNKQNNIVSNLEYIHPKRHRKETEKTHPQVVTGIVNYNKYNISNEAGYNSGDKVEFHKKASKQMQLEYKK